MSTYMLRRKQALSVLPGRPKHVARAFIVGVAACDKQVVGQAVDVFERRFRHALAFLVPERDHDALGAPADGAGEMQIGRRLAAARKDKRLERRKLAVDPVDFAL